MSRSKFSAVKAAMLMLSCSSTAFAQEAKAQSAAPPQASHDNAADSGAANSGVGDIIVTAQRFSETAQKTPLILSVINSDALKGVSDVRQLQTIDPGVQIGAGGGLTQTFIRGVGSVTVLAGQESSVAYNVDGVYLFSPGMITPQMYDLERIEVLKGPQGTLYGRNASGGAINLITAGAKLNETEGYLEGEYGNYNRIRLEGAVNLPLGSTAAVRLSGQHVEHDGYLSDGTDDQNLTSLRARLLWEPSPTVTLRLGADYAHYASKGPGSSLNPNPTSDNWVGGLDPRVNQGATTILSLPPLLGPYLRGHQWSVNAQLDVNLGFATLTLLPAYRELDQTYIDYVPGFADTHPVDLTRQKSLEARLANRSDALKWVVGGYFFRVDQAIGAGPRQELFGQDNSLSKTDQSVESYAFFGEGTYSITKAIRVTGGLRYTHEKTRATGDINESVQAPPFPGPGPSTPAFNPWDPVTNPTGEFFDYVVNQQSHSSAVSWKAGLEADLSPDSMAFVTASRGFKGGGTYYNRPGFDATFRPEYLTAFELGSRNRFLNNSLQVNGELFYWKLKDQQITYLGFNSVQQLTLITANAGKAHMYGGSLDVTWKATPNDTLHGAVEYTKSKYDEFKRDIPSALVLPSQTCAVIGYSGPASFAPATIDCSGKPVIRAPEWALTAGYEHSFDLGRGNQLIFNGDFSYTSGRYLTLTYRPLSYQKGNTNFNAALTYKAKSPGVTVSAWIRNIANSRVIVNADNDSFFDNFTRVVLAPPRTFGMSVRYNF